MPWAANMTAAPCINAVPSMLIVAPNGIVNDGTSEVKHQVLITFQEVKGMVAFDEDDENAKNAMAE